MNRAQQTESEHMQSLIAGHPCAEWVGLAPVDNRLKEAIFENRECRFRTPQDHAHGVWLHHGLRGRSRGGRP